MRLCKWLGVVAVLGLSGVMLIAADKPADKPKDKDDKETKVKAPTEGEVSKSVPGKKELPKDEKELLEKMISGTRGSGSTASVPSNPPRSWATSSSYSLNNQILAFCRNNMGRRVGDGECAALNQNALKAIRAKYNFANRKDTPHRDDYVWGTYVKKITSSNRSASGVQPGDLLQMRGPQSGAAFKGTTTSGGTYWSSFYHHSSIVSAVGQTSESWWIATYDQNVSNERWVHTHKMTKLKDMQNGVTLWVYRATK